MFETLLFGGMCTYFSTFQKSEKGIRNRFLLLKHSGWRPSVAFPGRAVFLPLGAFT